MRILIFDKFLGYQVGGAQNSLHYLLKNLKGDFKFLGCDVRKSFLAEKYKLSDWEVERIKIKEFPRFPYFEYWYNRKRVKKFIASQGADLLIAQGLWGAIAVNAFVGRSIYFIRDEYHFNKIPVYQTGFKRILKKIYIFSQFLFIRKIFKDNRKSIKHADLVVANSRFIADKIKEIFNRDIDYIWPLIDVKDLIQKNSLIVEKREFIVGIGSELIKGGPIIEKIANILPDHKFMIVSRSFNNSICRRNILYHPWVKNVNEIYDKMKIILIPSLCEDAFCSGGVKAWALGIPALGSNRGGIPEVLGEEFLIKDVWNIEEWKIKILEIEKNYDQYPNKLKQKSLEFDAVKQIEKFKKIVQDKMNISL